jgi:hypothetical protein
MRIYAESDVGENVSEELQFIAPSREMLLARFERRERKQRVMIYYFNSRESQSKKKFFVLSFVMLRQTFRSVSCSK